YNVMRVTIVMPTILGACGLLQLYEAKAEGGIDERPCRISRRSTSAAARRATRGLLGNADTGAAHGPRGRCGSREKRRRVRRIPVRPCTLRIRRPSTRESVNVSLSTARAFLRRVTSSI